MRNRRKTQQCVPVVGPPVSSNESMLGCVPNACSDKVSQSVEANLTGGSQDPSRGHVKVTPVRVSNCVFVVSQDRKPLTPCTAARARQLLKSQRAAVLRRYPFTIILLTPTKTDKENPLVQELEIRGEDKSWFHHLSKQGREF